MKKALLMLTVVFLWTCSGGSGGGPTEPQEPTYVVNLASLSGNAQKGPFNNGTAINIAELTNTLSPTGRNFSTAITDNTGRFSVTNVQLESPYVELRANGYYFNEVSNQISSGQLTLFALSNLSGKTSLNVNILTHLEKNRMTTLIGNPDNPKTFAQAKVQAQEEVFAIFDYSRANVPESELLDISQGGAANAKLLAISAIVQGDLTVGQMSELLANISTDIASDGTLDDATLRNTLISNTVNLDLAQIRANLEARYASLGISANIPDFETEVNQFLKPPVANDMNLSTDEDTQINITLDASDPENESLTFSTIEVNNATVTINGNVANYVPDAHFNGTDTFTYKANDGTSDSNIATVTVTVNAIDDEPNTNDISTTTDEDVSVTLTLTADEYDGQNYSFSIISNPSNGTATLSGATVTYVPNQDWNGTDTFTFEATDDRTAKTNVATATITVNAVNDAPTSSEVSGSADEDNSVDIELSATDVDGDNLTYSIVSDVSNGTTSISGSTLTYAPNQDWNGTDTFTYKVNDGIVDSNTSNGNITIASINDTPIANDMTVSTNETKFISLDITLDVTDVDGDALTYSIESNVSNGTATLNEGIVTYVPTTDWNGEDSFTFKANDGIVDSNIATTTITVNVVDDAPVVVDSTFVIDEDQVTDITLTASDVDDEDLFTWAAQTGPSNGTVVILDANSSATASKTYRYTPNTNYNGNDSFTYYATNQNAQISNTATISFTINPVNDGPIANDLTMTVDEDWTGATVTIKGDDNGATDPEGDAITYYIVDAPSNGNIYNDGGGGVPAGDALVSGDELTSAFTIYNPNENFNGEDTFTFKGNDGSLDGNVATVTVNVNAVNDIPTLIDFSDVNGTQTRILTLDEDTPAEFLLATDIDGDVLSMTINNGTTDGCDGATGGVYSTSGATISISPGPNCSDANGMQKEVSITISDGQSSLTPRLFVYVTPIDDLPTAIDFTASTAEDNSVDITLQYEDVDGDVWPNLTYELSSSPTNGTVTLNTEKTIATYTPNTGFFGTDAFNYSTEAGSSVEGTVTITINEVVGTLKIYPDLTSDYNEWYSDIVYDESTGGFLVHGRTMDKNDSGSGGTSQMFHLATDANLNSTTYQTVSTTVPGWSSYHNSSHEWDISERSLDGGYLLSRNNERLWSVASGGGSVIYNNDGIQLSGYTKLDYIKANYQTSDGGYLIFGQTQSPSTGTDPEYPTVVKIDASLNLEYFKALDSHFATSTAIYESGYIGAVEAGNNTDYYFIASTSRVGFSNSRALQFYKVQDNGSSISVLQYAELANENNGDDVVQLFREHTKDTVVYISGSSGTTSEFAVVVETPQNTPQLRKYSVDTSGTVQVEADYDLTSQGGVNTDQVYFEIVNSGNYIYVVYGSDPESTTTDGSINSDIYVTQLDQNLNVNWHKTIDVTGLGYPDRFGGLTSINFGSNGTGIAITGSTKNGGDFNGFILLLDENGERIH